MMRLGLRDCAGIGWGRGAVLAVASGAPMTLLVSFGLLFAPASHGSALGPGTVTIVGVVYGAVMARAAPPLLGLAGLALAVAGLCVIALGGAESDSNTVLFGSDPRHRRVEPGELERGGSNPSLTMRWQGCAMVVRRRFSRALLPLVLYGVSAAAVGFFIHNAQIGERGLDAKQVLKVRIFELNRTLDEARAEHATWDRRLALMKADEVDRDLLEERARLVLGRVNKNDLVIIAP